ncbi:MAG: hypothetical protein F8N37_09950 [Telmatospirillum sp.]|nr:hypothetical protein [Telmatospirillum sp.]
MTTATKEQRDRFAEEIGAACGIKSKPILHAFATVPRESFLPPGPWVIEAIDGMYYTSQNDDVSHVLHAVGVALDINRALNNANPARIGRALEAASFLPGDTVLHVGAGTGYFSAIIAELIGPRGLLIAAEIDEQLARSARFNLAPWPNIHVVGDALTCPLPPLDVVFASAGSPVVPRRWIDALRPGGRMVLPITGSMNIGISYVIWKTDQSMWLTAQPKELVRFYPCIGTRDLPSMLAMDAAFADPRGLAVKSLRLDAHDREETCWLHGHDWCLTLATRP